MSENCTEHHDQHQRGAMDEKAHREPADSDVEAARPDGRSQKHAEKSATPPTTDRSLSPDSSNADIIDWKGPDDPELPINWPRAKKWRNVLLVATLTFLTFVSRCRPSSSPRLTHFLAQPLCLVNVRPRHRPGHGRDGHHEPRHWLFRRLDLPPGLRFWPPLPCSLQRAVRSFARVPCLLAPIRSHERCLRPVRQHAHAHHLPVPDRPRRCLSLDRRPGHCRRLFPPGGARQGHGRVDHAGALGALHRPSHWCLRFAWSRLEVELLAVAHHGTSLPSGRRHLC